MRFSVKQDFVAGALFLVIGAGALWIGAGYDVGSLTRTGPGFAPRALSIGLIVLGAIIALRSVWRDEGLEMPKLGPILAVLGALGLFALLIDLGLVVAILAMVVFMYFASGERRFIEAVIVGALLAAFIVALFVVGLELPMKVFWW